MNVSIITVTYNSERTVRDTITSVLSQNFDDIEYIVIDGNSEDSTLDIINEYKDHFKNRLLLISEKDKGIYDAMNKGISMASGDIIGILNSDDFYIDNHIISEIIHVFEETSCDAVCGNLYFVNFEKTDKIVRSWKGSAYENGAFARGWHPAHPTFFLKRECYKKFGLYDIKFDISADFELMLRMIEKHKIKIEYLDRFFVKMRTGGESTGSLIRIFQGNINVMRAFKKNRIPVSYFYPVKRLVPKFIEIVKNKIKLK